MVLVCADEFVCVRVQYLMAHRLPRWERVILYIIIPVSLALSAVGIISSIKELISQYRGSS